MKWTCKECGSYNDGAGLKCTVCGAVRPEEVQCVCPECQSSQAAFPGMRCGECGHLFTVEDFSTLRPDPRPVPPPDPVPPVPVPPPQPYPPGPGPVPPPEPAEERKRPSLAVIIAVAAIIVVGALAALFIVKYFDRERPTEAVDAGHAATTAVLTQAATAPVTTAPPATKATTAAPTTAKPVTSPPTTARPTAPATTAAPVTAPPTTAPPVVTSFDLYETTIRNYGSTRVARASQMGYNIGFPSYDYAIKDVNADGTDELVIRESDGAGGYFTGAVYTLDGSRPVELYFIERHGSCYIMSDGCIVNMYKSATVQSIIGARLFTVAQSGNFVSDDPVPEMNAFLQANGFSTEQMTFDFYTF